MLLLLVIAPVFCAINHASHETLRNALHSVPARLQSAVLKQIVPANDVVADLQKWKAELLGTTAIDACTQEFAALATNGTSYGCLLRSITLLSSGSVTAADLNEYCGTCPQVLAERSDRLWSACSSAFGTMSAENLKNLNFVTSATNAVCLKVSCSFHPVKWLLKNKKHHRFSVLLSSYVSCSSFFRARVTATTATWMLQRC